MILGQEQQKEYLSKQYPMIATPCYGGLVHEPYLRGMTSLAGTAAGVGLAVNMATIVNESLITRARNELVKYLTMTDCTHLFFIDADISFTPDDVIRTILHDKDIVTGAYPLKKVRWDQIDTSKAKSPVDVQKMATDYVINVKFQDDQQRLTGQVPVVDGLIEVHDAGTGFMCIKRHVIEKMIDAHPETHYKKELKHVIHDGDDGQRWAIFDTMIDEDNRYLSEDYTFCRRWQRLGGQIWLDPQTKLSHIGTHNFEGHSMFEMQDAQVQGQQGLIGG